ncbi:haloacid dehalogenase superfamily, subfamily IA, variant 3 with third motif having DD or ED [Polaribacter sp. KT25b]|uniref:HAD family hydrolase n=1 Tax=Polaribacter sp. KT25b TaxID=1855336 RepID=UPI00087AE349|nr:HAD family phosphatase [Polaribacter sp. KT25b]SDR69498.1 haloacid dehalogenase superfamily, subfamily IA, variant 3 with third motif having DD or ED [Polaribacter sp. KT25b]
MILPKGFLFDFDGVIVDSFESHYSAWTSAFKELFDAEIAPFPKFNAGKSPMIIAEYFCSVIGKEAQTEELYFLKDKHIETRFKVPKLLPGVIEFTSFLSEEKIPYGIASNATRQFLKNSIQHLNLNFTTVFGVEDYEKPKPSPEAYITLAKALGFKNDDFKNIWIFEDSLTGTKAAKLAGMIPIGITTQYSDKELKDAGSILVFPTLLEAYEHLTK